MENMSVDSERYHQGKIKPALSQPLFKSVDIGKPQLLPLPHQQKAMDKWWDSIKSGKTKGALVMATASGKTNIAIWCIKDYLKMYGLKNVLFVSHLEQIWEQTETRFKKLFPEISCGFYVGDRKDGINTGITIASVFTLYRAIKDNNILFSKDHFKFIVIDEFHHTATSTYQKVLNYFNSDILLGMSCLKERNDNQKFLHYFGDNIIYELDTVTAIYEGAIAGFKYYAIKDDIDYKVNKNGFKYNEFDQNRRLILPEKDKKVVEKWMELANGKKTIVFCATIEHANRMAEYFNERGVSAVAIHHHYYGGIKSTPKTMDERTNGFRNGKYLVACTIDKWLEGADFPDAEVALLMRPTKSWRIFLQSRGRVLRVHNGKKFGIVIDAVGNHKWIEIYKNLVKEHIIYEVRRIKEANPKDKVKVAGKEVSVTDVTNTLIDSLQSNEIVELYEEVKKNFSKAYNPGRKEGSHGRYKGPIEYEHGVFGLEIEEVKDILFKTGEVQLTKEHLIRDYLELEKKIGHQPKKVEYERNCHSLSLLNKVFGKPGWRSMLIEIKGRDVLANIGKEHLIKDFYDLEKNLGRQPIFTEYRNEHHDSGVLGRVFGKPGWGNMLKEIGRDLLVKRDITVEQLIQDYYDLKKKLEISPTRVVFGHASAIRRLFGGWNNFLISIGEVPLKTDGLTKEHLIKDFKDLKKNLRRQPTWTEFRSQCHGGLVLRRVFGEKGWIKLIKCAGDEPIFYNKRLTKSHLIQDYKKLKKVLGRKPREKEYEKQCHSLCAMDTAFGKPGWINLQKASGVSPILNRYK